MDQVLLTKWIEALESGDYKKTSKDYLRADNAWTLKGVLCDIARSALKADWIDNPAKTEPYYYILGNTTDIPKVLKSKIKINKNDSDLIDTCQTLYKSTEDFSLEIEYLKEHLTNEKHKSKPETKG